FLARSPIMFTAWRRRLREAASILPLEKRQKKPRQRSCLPCVEPLEDRCLLSFGDLLYTASDPSMGRTVSLSDNYLVAGESGKNTGASQSGSALVFDAATGNRLWTLNDPAPVASGDKFGLSVGVSGNYVVVGAPGKDVGSIDIGAAYVYDATTGSLLRTLNNPEPGVLDNFGYNVAISGTRALIGTPFDD